MDRNCSVEWHGFSPCVALLAEGVDRNFASSGMNDVDEVALLAEGVDRNRLYGEGIRLTAVALLAEGVDRNFRPRALSCPEIVSPSSRRAWIEIARRQSEPHGE